MSDLRWQRVRELFSAAVERPAAERRAFLESECGDESLVAEVESLLTAASTAGPVEALERWLDPVHRELDGHRRPDRESPPDRLGPYEVERELGRGGMGIVYLARDPRLDRPVAVKVLYPHLASDEEMISRFLAEARAASSLDHAHVCTVHDLDRLPDGRLYIAMSYYPGGSLADRLRGGRLAVDEALRIADEVAAGLDRTHRAGIVHRDVKPANIAFSADGVSKILDFGVAKLASSIDTLPGVAIGTPRYMAPEQLRGEPVDRRADVWSLGVVLYEMLTGRPPFDAADLDILRRRVLDEEPTDVEELRPEVPEAVAATLRKALRKRPEERLPSARRFAAGLASANGGEAGTSLEVTDPGFDHHAGAVARARRSVPPLPVAPTRFIGRERELEALLALLRRSRLVTLTGPGGTGKSRLALEAAARLVAAGEEIRLVQLADLREARQVPPAIADVLGVETGAGRESLDTVAAAIGESRLLLILDNLEHLPEAAPVLAELLERCPRLTALVTSRGPLRLTAEHELPVSPLSTESDPEKGRDRVSAAAQLFVDRARAALPDLDLDDDGRRVVDEICRRLDGLPLALELAAARLRLFSLDQLLDQIRLHIDLPGRGPRDHPDRHRTLGRAIGWSYELLDPESQRLFRSLAVFRGGFTLEQVGALAACEHQALAEGLDALLDQSLIARISGERGVPRFGMLELLRAYALERLRAAGEECRTRRRHRRLCRRLAEEAEPHLEAGEQRLWLERLDREYENLRAALEAGADGGPEDTEERLLIATALWRYWIARGYFREGLETLEGLIAAAGRDGAEPATQIRARLGAATLAHNLGRNRRARELLGEARVLCEETGDEGALLCVANNLAWAALETTELDEAEARGVEGLELARRLGDLRAEAVALNNLGFLAAYREDWDRAAERHRESLARRERAGDRRGAAFARINLAWAERERGDLQTSEDQLEQAQDQLEALGDRLFVLWSTCHRMALSLARGEPERIPISPELVARAREVGNQSMVAELLYWQAAVALARGELDEAEPLAEEALAVCEGYGWPWGIARSATQLGDLAARRGDREAAERWWQRALDTASRAGLAKMAERLRERSRSGEP